MYSMDAGMDGHPFMSHYFDMAQDHVQGKLSKMKIGRDIERTPVRVLILKPGKEQVNWKNRRAKIDQKRKEQVK